MESTSSWPAAPDDPAGAAEAMRTLERAEAAPYVDFPPTPWWYPPATGLWAAGLVASIASRDAFPVASPVALGVLVVLEVVFLRWYTRYHGALPSLRHPPAEFRPLFGAYAAGVAAVVLLTVLSYLLVGPAAGVVVVGVLVTVGLVVYERAYAAAAAATRARLG